MGLCHVKHTIEYEIVFRHFARIHRCAKALLVMTSVDPAVRKTMFICRCMVMEHAFRCMQNVFTLKSERCKSIQKIVEIAIGRFV